MARWFAWLDDLRHDAGYVLRTWRRSPGFMLIGVAVMALGIGANTAVFSVVNAVLLRPLPYQDPDRIVTLSRSVSTADGFLGTLSAQVALPDVEDWRRQADGFEAIAYYTGARRRPVEAGGEAEYANVSRIAPGFFRAFAARPAAGRLLTEDDHAGTAGGVLVSDAYARSRFGGTAQAIGRSLRLLGRPGQIVGVLPGDFDYPLGTDIWFPDNPATNASSANRSQFNFLAIGRLRNGVSLEQAQAQMTSVAARLAQQYPENSGRGVTVTRLQDQMVGNVRLMLFLLLAAVGVVLLIACANVATLLLARATARTQEIAVRAALGASRARLARQMLAEGLMQGLSAGVAGLALAAWGTRALVALAPGNVPRLSSVAVDGPVLAFTFGVSVVSSVLLSVLPALQASRIDVESSLRQGGTRAIVGRRSVRAREALVVGQLALAVVLLATGGLLVRSLLALQRAPLGFRPQNVLLMEATIANPDPREGGSVFFRDLLADVRTLPGVLAAGATMATPGRIDASGSHFIDRLPPREEQLRLGTRRISTVLSVVSPGTFAALGIPLVRGRDFQDGDDDGSPRVAIVNEALVRQTLPGQDPIGHTVFCTFDSDQPMTIVGVVGDVRQAGPSFAPQPECYMPYLQHFYNGATLSLVIRTANDPTLLADSVRLKARALSPAVPVSFGRLETELDQHLAAPRFRALLIGVFAAVALVLAVIGVFGVMTYVVGQRTAEIGLRVALGATRGRILRLLFGRALALVGLGLAIGLSGAMLATRYLGALLFEIQPSDPLTYAGVGALLLTASLIAVSVPALRAIKIDPVVALRGE